MKNKKESGPRLIFLVEDNMTFLRSMQIYFKSKFPEAEVAIFPSGELCMFNLHLDPDFIVLDFHLDAKYPKAANGLEIVKMIRAKQSKAKIIMLSSQEKIDVAVKVVHHHCSYVEKDQDALEKVALIIEQSVRRQEVPVV